MSSLVTGKYEFAPEGTDDFKDLTDREVNSMWRRLCKESGPARKTDVQTVIESDFVPLYNPFREYVDALRQGLSTVKIGMVMSQAGFQQVRVAGKRGYRVVELTGDEIYRNQQAMGRFV